VLRRLVDAIATTAPLLFKGEEDTNMALNGPTKKELENLLNDVGDKLQEMLDPALTREDLVTLVQELDSQINGDDDEDDEDQDEDDDSDV